MEAPSTPHLLKWSSQITVLFLFPFSNTFWDLCPAEVYHWVLFYDDPLALMPRSPALCPYISLPASLMGCHGEPLDKQVLTIAGEELLRWRKEGRVLTTPHPQPTSSQFPLLQQLLTLISSFLQIWAGDWHRRHPCLTHWAFQESTAESWERPLSRPCLERTWQPRNEADWKEWRDDLKNGTTSRVGSASRTRQRAGCSVLRLRPWVSTINTCLVLGAVAGYTVAAHGSDSRSQVISLLTQFLALSGRTT